ncbi:hypothetical protein PHLCEN_2v9731 [Hermanssonia centrifuga]|uniref:Uncharacterized protein n=1 Tax=Hermanssonia centrifuga TaxID=98765 RepID=A0A2R6NPX3_9APHY|nr:hypothetical protein PHLCEN_2v9731 [Hermanssonia centrifuga]
MKGDVSVFAENNIEDELINKAGGLIHILIGSAFVTAIGVARREPRNARNYRGFIARVTDYLLDRMNI